MRHAIRAMRRHKRGVIMTVILSTIVVWVACNWNLKTRTPPAARQATAPDFALRDHAGRMITLDSLVENGPAVIVFYRGYW